MIRKIGFTLFVILLAILPFVTGIAISRYSPYLDGNPFQTFVLIWAAISIAFGLIVWVLWNYYHATFGRLFVAGALLFLLICPIFGIVGLASPPDLSLKMLDHPEREHLRYLFLFLAAILSSVSFFFTLRNPSFNANLNMKRLLTGLAILATSEFAWEFTHHYLYPEALQEWINQGKNVKDFSVHYDISIIWIGVLGRYVQYLLILLLSIVLYRLRHIKIWSTVLCVFFSSVGIAASTVVYITMLNFPKGFEFLMMFFIPGFPFLLLYWLGVALLTKLNKGSEGIHPL